MKDSRIAAIGVIVALMLVFTAGLPAQMFISTGRDTLRGLPGVEVAVEPLPPELEQAGLTTAMIRTDVEQRLRAGGVTIYATQKENPSIAKPYVYVHLNALMLPGQRQAVAVQVHLRQTLRSPVTDSNIVNAMTWDAHNVIGLANGDLRSLRNAVLDMVDGFIADWRSVQ